MKFVHPERIKVVIIGCPLISYILCILAWVLMAVVSLYVWF